MDSAKCLARALFCALFGTRLDWRSGDPNNPRVGGVAAPLSVLIMSTAPLSNKAGVVVVVVVFTFSFLFLFLVSFFLSFFLSSFYSFLVALSFASRRRGLIFTCGLLPAPASARVTAANSQLMCALERGAPGRARHVRDTCGRVAR